MLSERCARRPSWYLRQEPRSATHASCHSVLAYYDITVLWRKLWRTGKCIIHWHGRGSPSERFTAARPSLIIPEQPEPSCVVAGFNHPRQ
jgi:hypothetical protein